MAVRQIEGMVSLQDDGGRQPSIELSTDWEVLGPFQIGTREATWGADPLEFFGGFRSLSYDEQSTYYSSLAVNGTIGWSIQRANSIEEHQNVSQADLIVDFPKINWGFLQSIYGWATLQYQAWARGYIIINAEQPQTVVLYSDSILEFWVDDTPYFGGDMYAYRRAPLVLRLDPGSHKLDVRLVRDLRSMGGVGEPKIEVSIRCEISNGGIAILKEKLLLPEVVNGVLASNLGSLPLRNEHHDWIEVVAVASVDDLFTVSLIEKSIFNIAPGQTRPLAFHISMLNQVAPKLSLVITYKEHGAHSVIRSPIISVMLSSKNDSQPHRTTFLHPGGHVSYAILRAPHVDPSHKLSNGQSLPILLNLHGAGLEADSEQVRHMLDSVPDIPAWVLFPTGVTPWSGDDWHVWGFADVQAAITAIPVWIGATAWRGPGAATDKLLISGHSNGGQGTWFALTHRPDVVLAAAPVSAYSSIQSYVPYQFWHEMDPAIAGLLQSALVSYRHELMTGNLAGVPVLQQHGSDDNNVPAYHSRRMNQLTSESGHPSKYIELANKGHWFEGIMETGSLRRFYTDGLNASRSKVDLPLQFTFVVPNSGDMGSRGGIMVDQLSSPDQLGRIDVVRNENSSTWVIKTSNIHRFHFTWKEWNGIRPVFIVVDSCPIFTVHDAARRLTQWFIRAPDGLWAETVDQTWQSETQRYGRQRGALDAFLRTRGKFILESPRAANIEVALQISRNLFQYFAADAEIVHSADSLQSPTGNIISISMGSESFQKSSEEHAIEIKDGEGISIRDPFGHTRLYPLEEGLGAIFLRPLPDERLNVVIWGVDDAGLRSAARLVPMLTGVGQPDFVIVSHACAWKGAAGILALGFLDYRWNVSKSSYLS